jgi:hypothetical protein
MPDPGAALMTALLHRANPALAQNFVADWDFWTR